MSWLNPNKSKKKWFSPRILSVCALAECEWRVAAELGRARLQYVAVMQHVASWIYVCCKSTLFGACLEKTWYDVWFNVWLHVWLHVFYWVNVFMCVCVWLDVFYWINVFVCVCVCVCLCVCVFVLVCVRRTRGAFSSRCCARLLALAPPLPQVPCLSQAWPTNRLQRLRMVQEAMTR